MVGARFEFKLADCWIGVFWKRSTQEECERCGREVMLTRCDRLDVWACLLPCLPLHIVWTGWSSVEFLPFVGGEPITSPHWERLRSTEM